MNLWELRSARPQLIRSYPQHFDFAQEFKTSSLLLFVKIDCPLSRSVQRPVETSYHGVSTSVLHIKGISNKNCGFYEKRRHNMASLQRIAKIAVSVLLPDTPDTAIVDLIDVVHIPIIETRTPCEVWTI